MATPRSLKLQPSIKSIEVYGKSNRLWQESLRILLRDKRLTTKRTLDRFMFPRRRTRAPERRGTRAKLAIFISFLLAFTAALICLRPRFYKERSPSQTDSTLPSNSPQKISLTRLQKPPSMAHFLPRKHGDQTERIVPQEHLVPFVYTAVGIPYTNSQTNNSEILLFLYTQGTLACTGEHMTPCSHLDITSCMVGGDFFPIIYDANGVYACSVTRPLRNGERLTVTASAHVWNRKMDTVEDRVVESHLRSMERLDDGTYVLSSDARWEGQSDPPVRKREGRYRVCVMTQEKHFPDYIPEWLTYHRRIGVDYVYIYDNNSPKNISDIYKNANDVEVVQWPWERSQIQAQNHFLLVGRRRCQWGILIDVDEFIMIRPGHYESKTERPLKALLRHMREKKDISQIRVKSVVLGSSGHIYQPRSSVVESYWHLARSQDRLTKPIVWTGHAMPDSTVHRVEISEGYFTALSKDFLSGEGEVESVGLCHYKFKSWEDYVEKGKGGRNSFQVGIWDYSANWSIHAPTKGHLISKNTETYTECRRIWRRTLDVRVMEVELASWDEAKQRYKRIKREGWVWKRRRGLIEKENATLNAVLIEQERAFHKLKDWELAKIDRLAQWNKTTDFLT